MLTLPIKKGWYDLIAGGVKKEEYREIKPYYTTRFRNIFGAKCQEAAAEALCCVRLLIGE